MDSPILKSIIDVVVEDFGFVVVKDQNDKIIYPIESARLNQIKHILMFGSINENEIELKNESLWYEKKEKKVEIEGKTYSIETFKDITNQKKDYQDLIYDKTTGLLIKDVAHEQIITFLKTGLLEHNKGFAIIMIDVDFFKNFNDSYGHVAGDIILKRVGSKIKGSIKHENKSQDICTRIGGEEMLIFLNNISEEDAYKRADQLRENIENVATADITGETNSVTASIGVTHKIITPEISKQFVADEAIEKYFKDAKQEADTALYYSKNAGRNKTTLYNSTHSLKNLSEAKSQNKR